MKLVTWAHMDGPRPGALTGEGVVDLSSIASSIEALIEAGPAGWERARDAATRKPDAHDPTLLAPLRPASLRDFLAFEDHAKAGAARRGEELNPAWYRTPVYYKGNHRSIAGPGEDVPWPSWSDRLDFEMELACVIGQRARDLDAGAAERAIFGYMIMNDWSARDVQRDEMSMRLGPAKSKDFATSLGPCIVTADEIDPRDGLTMIARINGEIWATANSRAMHWTFPQMIAHVAAGEDVWPGDVYGSGTAFGGCGLDQDRWIQPGDVVALEVERIGTLQNRLVR